MSHSIYKSTCEKGWPNKSVVISVWFFIYYFLDFLALFCKSEKNKTKLKNCQIPTTLQSNSQVTHALQPEVYTVYSYMYIPQE